MLGKKNEVRATEFSEGRIADKEGNALEPNIKPAGKGKRKSDRNESYKCKEKSD